MQIEKTFLKSDKDGNKNQCVNLLNHQVIPRVVSPLCANLHGGTDGEELIYLLSEIHLSMLFSVKRTSTWLDNSTYVDCCRTHIAESSCVKI